MTVQLRRNAEELARTDAVAVAPATFRGGLAAGTPVLTARGLVAVENLRRGDRIVTRERGLAVLRAVTRHLSDTVVVRADSLGQGRPRRDTTLAADQHVTIRDWRAEALFDAPCALVPVARLADGRQIAAAGRAEVWRLDFGSALTIQADGLEAPSGRTESHVVVPASHD
ncbi:Hint domain-containing protein [Jannaschia rubra]|uniref:Hedgehog/Intein (Hint) domain-containing protein n=1 Tax=Jannaschia rubra TaxID=282197 RepID=A0A0M6XKU3_9RHOB|nr:Hint domain-containing protein [Jannaschia rubra]CTQ31766.1 hypothetical protein JAN5088_00525 [Jannaschia rubra]SFG54465.1 Hint domain-containing protein [Jannaschia rubra]